MKENKVDENILVQQLHTNANRLGISAIGIAPYDPHYTYEEFRSELAGYRSVVVCILEQNNETTQLAPDVQTERAALTTYAVLLRLAAKLSEPLRSAGYRAEVQDPAGKLLAIPYAVEAGLGQMGLNGQLLTPQAGSRCRIILIGTDAELPRDFPVDLGIPKLCDACQVCVQRCPSGAIPSTREYHRGVLKAKIKTERCLPIVAQNEGCAVCMKVCPVQKFGLERVWEVYEESGVILGKGTDDLEGYMWPLTGEFFGSGEKPRMTQDIILPEGLNWGDEGTVADEVGITDMGKRML